MYTFATITLMGLGVLAVGMIGHRYLSLAREYWALLLVALGIGAAWLADFSMFAVWGMPSRNHAIGVWLTGLAIAGAAWFWRVLLQFFNGMSRKFTDQARTMEKSENLRRAA